MLASCNRPQVTQHASVLALSDRSCAPPSLGCVSLTGVLMASGMLPALEGVFRTIPPACQAQVAAAELLVSVCGGRAAGLGCASILADHHA